MSYVIWNMNYEFSAQPSSIARRPSDCVKIHSRGEKRQRNHHQDRMNGVPEKFHSAFHFSSKGIGQIG